MSVFPTAKDLASWAGQCPGNDQSAGKRRSGKTRKGSKWLDWALEEAALAATRSKDTYLAAQYPRLRPRRGHKKALGAVKHSIIVACWHMLTTGEIYNDLGGDYFARRDPDRTVRNLVRKLEALGQENHNPAPTGGGVSEISLQNCVSDSVLPSGSLNHATCAPPGERQTPSASCSTPSMRSKTTPRAVRPATVVAMSSTLQPSTVNGYGVELLDGDEAQQHAVGAKRARDRARSLELEPERLLVERPRLRSCPSSGRTR